MLSLKVCDGYPYTVLKESLRTSEILYVIIKHTSAIEKHIFLFRLVQ